MAKPKSAYLRIRYWACFCMVVTSFTTARVSAKQGFVIYEVVASQEHILSDEFSDLQDFASHPCSVLFPR